MQNQSLYVLLILSPPRILRTRKERIMSTSTTSTTATTSSFNKVEAVKAIMERSESLGRKFSDFDAFSYNEFKVAHAFAAAYEGSFDFMNTMRNWVKTGAMLTNRQTASVLNCLVAEMKRRMSAKTKASSSPAPKSKPAATPTPSFEKVPNGYYTIEKEGDRHITIRIEDAPEEWKTAGRVVGVLTGPVNTSDYTNFGFIYDNGSLQPWKKFAKGFESWKEAVKILVQSDKDERVGLGKAYALRSGRCWRCGRVLTVPESIRDGIGPECKKKLG